MGTDGLGVVSPHPIIELTNRRANPMYKSEARADDNDGEMVDSYIDFFLFRIYIIAVAAVPVRAMRAAMTR